MARKGKEANGISNAKKKIRRNKLTKVLALLYLLAFVVFEVTIAVLNVLPAKIMLITMIVLPVVSVVIFIQLFFNNVKRWAKITASVLSVLLIIVYCFGTVYAVKTLSFLDDVSTDKNRDAAKVTEESFNVLVTGIDVWGRIDEKGRSDVNMIVTVNPKKHKILLTSIPRDYQIRLMNYGKATDKLTHTGFYGVEDTETSLEDLLGIDINYYIKVNFSTLVKFIDAIGGVNVNAEQAFTIKMSDPSKGDQDYTFKVGKNHLNGTAALAFARDRKSFTAGDNQRIRDQQLIFEAIINKSTNSKTLLKNYPSILSNIKPYYEMNFRSSEIKALIKLQLGDNPDWKIEKNSVAGVNASEVTYSGGATPLYVMGHDQTSLDAATAKINETMSMKDESKGS